MPDSPFKREAEPRAPLAAGGGEERSRLPADTIVDYSILMLDGRGCLASWNAAAERAAGFAAGELPGRHLSVFYTDEDLRAGVPEAALRTARSEGRFEREGWRVRKDGARYWAHMVIDAVRDASGEVVGFVEITRDLTERRAAEEMLLRSEQQFRLLVQSVTDYAIFMLDRNGFVSSWNLGARRIKGYAPEEIIGEHFSRFYTPEDRAAGLPQFGLEQARREGRFENEGWRVRKDGSRFMAHVVLDAIRDDDGEVIGFAKITRDITERKQAQQSLEQAQRALFQTQKLESLGQLTGGIAHDFNNLLTAIIGSLELLRKRLPDDARARALLENAIHGAERGSTLTQRMLAFARRQDLKLQAIDLCMLVHGMSGLLERSLGPGVALLLRVTPDLPRVCSDANQLETALLNLAVNARDAMRDGGTITIDAREERVREGGRLGLQNGNYVCLSVADSGHGMDERTLSHATEPFFTTKGVGKGTGLGLSMVQGLAEQSGGKLAIGSQVGAGTTVEIWLPVASGMPERPAQRDSEGAARDLPGLRGVILVVDDDELVLLSTSALLDDLGYSVLEASSGMRALELVAREPRIELVLTDQAMPGMTGLQLAKAIKELRPELPIILATGYADLPQPLPQQLRRLSKPYRLPELAAAVAEAFEQASARD